MGSGIRKATSWCIVSLLLLTVLCIVFAVYLQPPLWPKSLGAFDMRYYYGPHTLLLDASMAEGRLPLWNPLALCGTPFAANPQSAIFYPFHLSRGALVAFIGPSAPVTSLSLHLALLFHMLFAGLSTFALAREYRLSYPASFLAAVIYMCGPFAIPNAIEFWNLVALVSWLPLVILLTRKALYAETWRRRTYFAGAAALAFGLSALLGFPQLTFYSALSIGLFCFFDRLLALEWKGRAVFAQAGHFAVQGAVILGVLFLGGALVAGGMLLPAQEFAGLSERIGGLQVSTAEQDLSPRHLLMSLALFPGVADYATQGLRTAGVCALLLALMAFAHERKRPAFLFGALFLALADITLGPPFPLGSLLKRLDVFNFGSPWRAGLVSALPLAMLVGIGADAVVRPATARWRGIVRREVLGLVGLTAIAGVCVWRWSDAPFPVSWAVVCLPMAGLVAIRVASEISYPRVMGSLVVAIAVGEIVVWGNALASDYASRRLWSRAPAALAEPSQMWAGNTRQSETRPYMKMWNLEPIINGYDALKIYRVRQALCAPYREAVFKGNLYDDEVMVYNQRGNLFLKRSFWLAREYVAGPLPGKEALFPAATTVFLPEAEHVGLPEVEPGEVEGRGVSGEAIVLRVADAAALDAATGPHAKATERVLQLPPLKLDGRHAVLRLRYSATGSGNVDVLFADGETGAVEKGKRQRIMRLGEMKIEIPLPDFAVCETSLTWSANLGGLRFLDAELVVDGADETGLITIEERTSNSVRVRLEDLPGRRVLTFVDAHYPGWRAYVDGERVPIFLANDAFKAVEVPAGTHEVLFTFRPVRVYVGGAISFGSMLVLAVFLIVMRHWRGSPSPEVEEAGKGAMGDGESLHGTPPCDTISAA